MNIMEKMRKVIKRSENLIEKLIVFGSGIVNGWMGLGAGMMLVPFFENKKGMNSQNAQATMMAFVWPMTLISAGIYWVKGIWRLDAVWILCIGALPGALLGAVFMKKMKNKTVHIIFAIITILSGVKMQF